MLRLHLARRVVVATIAAFVALVVLAMRAYPGGTSWNASAPGHDFWLNYLCDLARPTALNGVPNPFGSTLAQAAMLALAVGLLPWWSLLARFVPSHPRAGRAMRVLGTSAAMRDLFRRLQKGGPTDLTVLVQGETGTGKELVAQAVHNASSRGKGPFVVVDCGAIAPTLAEATLFGHEKGAFTGATSSRESRGIASLPISSSLRTTSSTSARHIWCSSRAGSSIPSSISSRLKA